MSCRDGFGECSSNLFGEKTPLNTHCGLPTYVTRLIAWLAAAEANGKGTGYSGSESPSPPLSPLVSHQSCAQWVRGLGACADLSGCCRASAVVCAEKGRSSFVPQSTFEPLPDDAWEAINEFYGLREDFPRKQLLLRNGASKVTTRSHRHKARTAIHLFNPAFVGGWCVG